MNYASKRGLPPNTKVCPIFASLRALRASSAAGGKCKIQDLIRSTLQLSLQQRIDYGNVLQIFDR